MSLPTVTVKAGFGGGPTSVPTWTDITADFQAAKTSRGRQRLQRTQAQFTAGTATVQLNNRARKYDPVNTASIYYPNVVPGTPIQILATWAGTTYPIWTGYAKDWPPIWPAFAEGIMPVTCEDLFGPLAMRRLVSIKYLSTILGDSPLAWWRLNDVDPATVAIDSASGTGQGTYPGTVVGTVKFGAAGALNAEDNSAADFGNATGVISAAGPPTSTSTFTIEFWAKTTTVPGSFPAAVLQIAQTAPAGFSPVPIWSVDITDPVTLTFTWGTGYSYVGQTSTEFIPDGRWHHYVFVYDLTHTTATGYTDGSAFQNVVISHLIDTYVPNVVVLGGQAVTLAPVYQGQLDEVAIYNTALTAAQVSAHYLAGAFPYPEFSGQRVGHILDALGFPSSMRNIDTGMSMLQAATQSITQTKSLQYLQTLEQSEQGQLFMGADGYVNFQDRYHRTRSPNATSVATFGDGGGSELPYSMGAFGLHFDWDELFNSISASRTGGAPQLATDGSLYPTPTGSIGRYGERQPSGGLASLEVATDAAALSAAQWILADTKAPQPRLQDLILEPHADDRLWPVVLGIEIGQMVTVNKHHIPGGGSAISLLARVEGIEHEISPPNKWKTVLHVTLIGAGMWLIYNDPQPNVGYFNVGARWGW